MYGNYRYWRIDDIIFDTDCDTFQFEDEKDNNAKSSSDQAPRKFTISQYYKDRYNMKVTKPRQPLIVHHQSRTGKVFYILPEFCVMTGIPEDITEFTRKKVTDLCIKQPHQRMSEIQNLIETMLNPVKQEYQPNEPTQYQGNNLAAIKELGIEFQGDPVFFEGKQLPAPRLLVGNKQTIDQRSGNFQMKQQIFEPGEEISWAILCTSDFRANRLLEQFQSWAKAFGIKMAEPRVFDYGKKDEGKKAMLEIEYILENKIPGFYDIVIIVLPNNMKSYYKIIKQKCYLTLGILSQVVLHNTLEKKGFYQICSKVLQQIVSKVGSKLWVSQPPKGLSEHTMLIGIDSSSDKLDKNRSVIAFCASMDQTFSRYYSRVIYQKKSEEIITTMKQLIKDSIAAYQKINGKFPEHVIYFRDGVLESVEREIQTKEVRDMFQGFSEQTQDQIKVPKITIILIDKRITQKFFSVDDKRQLENPVPGTLIDNTIASKYYDFYLIAQNVTRGTATPTHYKVIFDNSEMPAEILQELVYSQCFAYMNWNGAIRVPAPCQYAHKLSSFISQHINDEPVKPLRNHFYYL
jgi:aubergine-like protein